MPYSPFKADMPKAMRQVVHMERNLALPKFTPKKNRELCQKLFISVHGVQCRVLNTSPQFMESWESVTLSGNIANFISRGEKTFSLQIIQTTISRPSRMIRSKLCRYICKVTLLYSQMKLAGGRKSDQLIICPEQKLLDAKLIRLSEKLQRVDKVAFSRKDGAPQNNTNSN